MTDYPKPNIVEVVEALGGMMAGPDRGGWRSCTCPIHDDGTASAGVNEDECRFHCFTCDLDGDAVDRQLHGLGRAHRDVPPKARV